MGEKGRVLPGEPMKARAELVFDLPDDCLNCILRKRDSVVFRCMLSNKIIWELVGKREEDCPLEIVDEDKLLYEQAR